MKAFVICVLNPTGNIECLQNILPLANESFVLDFARKHWLFFALVRVRWNVYHLFVVLSCFLPGFLTHSHVLVVNISFSCIKIT